MNEIAPVAQSDSALDSAPAHRTYRARLASAEQQLRALDRRSALIAHLRTLAFGAAVVLVLASLIGKLGNWSFYAAGVCAAAYAFFAIWHDAVFRREAYQRALVRLNQRGIDRLTGAWQRFPETGDRFLEPDHLYSGDLNIFGSASLFQLMNETGTLLGEKQLAAWLRAPADPPELQQRQAAVRELTPLIQFRQTLIARAQLAAKTKADPTHFIEWAEHGVPLDSIRWTRALAWLVPLGTLALYVLGKIGLVRDSLWWGGLGALALLVVLTRKPLERAYEAVASGEIGFIRFDEVFATLKSQVFDQPNLKKLSARLEVAKVTDRLQQFRRLFSFLELRQSGLMHAVIHLLTLWDVHWTFRMEKWRERHGREVRGWFENLAEVEALCALATFAHDRPEYTYPELSFEGPLFIAHQLGHPLLPHPIPNDVSLDGPGHALLITGSNMSGKSTLLRSIGTNAVLALAGAPTCARYLKVSKVAVLTSIRIKDSLEQGISYFYAEVRRIKAILAAAEAARGNALFLLDEILLGTNSEERAIASRGILRLLLRTGACGAVSTHDVSLASLGREPDLHIRNVHFRESILNGRMSFDYRLRDGVLESGNALRVLREAGISLPD